MTDDKAIEAALQVWFGVARWKEDHADMLRELRNDMRAAIAAADKVRAEGFDIQAEVDAWWLTDRHFTDLANRAFSAGLAKGEAARAALVEALEKIAKQDDIELALDPQWAKFVARHALPLVRKGE